MEKTQQKLSPVTIGDLRDKAIRLRVGCGTCGHSNDIDVAKLEHLVPFGALAPESINYVAIYSVATIAKTSAGATGSADSGF